MGYDNFTVGQAIRKLRTDSVFIDIVYRAKSVAKHYEELNRDMLSDDEDSPVRKSIEKVADEARHYDFMCDFMESAFDDDYDADSEEYDDSDYFDDDLVREEGND